MAMRTIKESTFYQRSEKKAHRSASSENGGWVLLAKKKTPIGIMLTLTTPDRKGLITWPCL
jgi:hypothetical protein